MEHNLASRLARSLLDSLVVLWPASPIGSVPPVAAAADDNDGVEEDDDDDDDDNDNDNDTHSRGNDNALKPSNSLAAAIEVPLCLDLPVDAHCPTVAASDAIVLPREPNVMQAIEAFKPRADDELLVAPGDVVTVLERYSDGWIMACNEGVCGVLPASFLAPLQVAAKWAFVPSSPDEVALAVGDLVDIYEFYDDGWALVRAPSGAAGMAPQSFLDHPAAAADAGLHTPSALDTPPASPH
ncbi:uncharacterized protein AMSG_09571 [Thecamonas trahens ATCC 50062]|uniref:SH3 domain-containing protein n=1 Tax=Thecamonas trahens ATCC 50062 TaxID=461836 RepID=A0A0L0DNP1_THETB|nr:hypothetical protein AMSG_09571 [Thecamonas trahens ATCC 50062]KNC53929.1 hypothetical protein AMSG_09571 [Thecamonas trahens ATCC 50062]|eukprot:XP_013754133.1 hypothetical protein AMSG_09571 [Thecamonas trahens ATCC 50062]